MIFELSLHYFGLFLSRKDIEKSISHKNICYRINVNQCLTKKYSTPKTGVVE